MIPRALSFLIAFLPTRIDNVYSVIVFQRSSILTSSALLCLFHCHYQTWPKRHAWQQSRLLHLETHPCASREIVAVLSNSPQTPVVHARPDNIIIARACIRQSSARPPPRWWCGAAQLISRTSRVLRAPISCQCDGESWQDRAAQADIVCGCKSGSQGRGARSCFCLICGRGLATRWLIGLIICSLFCGC